MHNFHHNYPSESRGAYYTCELISLAVSQKWQETTVQRQLTALAAVGICSCCLMLTARMSSFNCRMWRIGPLDVLGTGMTVSCSPLPSCCSPGRGNGCMRIAQAVQQRCADVNVSMNAHRRVCVCKLILSVCGWREHYLALSCGHL